MRRAGIDAGDVRGEIDPIHNAIRRQLGTPGSGSGRIHIEMVDRRVIGYSGWYLLGPSGQKRHAYTTFEQRDFPTAIGGIDVWQTNVACSAVV